MSKLQRVCIFSFLTFFAACTGKKKIDPDKSFRINVGSGGTQKDPLFNLDQERLKILSLVFEPLLGYSSNGEIVPILVSDLPTLSADQLTYNFVIKPGVAFHPSKKLDKARVVTSKDVIMSLLRGVVNPESSNYGSLLTGLIEGLSTWPGQGEYFGKPLPTGIQIKSDTEFSIKLMRKFPDFLALLTLPAFSVQPHEIISAKTPEAIGTGPYKFIDSGAENSNWDLEGPETAKFPFVQVMMTNEAKEVSKVDYAALSLKMGAELIDPTTGTLKNLPDHQLQELPIKRLEFFAFNLNDPVIKTLGPDFRRAVMSVLNLQGILESIYRGFSLNSQQLIPPGVEGSLSEASLKIMKPEEAKKKIASVLKGKKLKVLFPQTATYWISELEKSLQAVGDYFEFESVDAQNYLARIEKGEFQFAPLSWEGDLPEATNYLQLYYSGNNANEQNLTGYKSATFDSHFDKLSRLFPSPERKRLAEDAHKVLLKDLPVIPLGFKKEFALVSKRASALQTKSFGATALKDFLLAP